MPKSFSVDKDDIHVFKRLATEAERSTPRVSESSLLVQILKDYFFVKDTVFDSMSGLDPKEAREATNGAHRSG